MSPLHVVPRPPITEPVTVTVAFYVLVLLAGLSWALIGYAAWWIYRSVNP